MAALPNFFGSTLALLLGLVLLFQQGVSLEPAPTATLMMLLAFVVVAGGVYGAFRRDPYRAIRFGIAASALTTILGGAIIASTDLSRVSTSIVTLGSFCIAVALVGYKVRSAYAADTIPNLLLTRTSRDKIRESNGVQWLGTQSTETFESATSIEVIFQNCVDATRTVRLRLVESKAPLASAKKVIVPEQVSALLTPSEVARVSVPIRALPRASGTVELEICVEVQGNPGRRSRRFRAKQAGTSLAEWLLNIPLLRGRWIRWASRAHFRYEIRPRTGANRNSLPAMNERWERLWTVAGGASTRPAPVESTPSGGGSPRSGTTLPSGLLVGSSRPMAPSSSMARGGISGTGGPEPSLSPSVTPRGTSVSGGPRFGSSRPAQTDPALAGPPEAVALSDGTRVRVRGSNSIRPAKIVRVDAMRVQCEFDDGRQAWVLPSQIEI